MTLPRPSSKRHSVQSPWRLISRRSTRTPFLNADEDNQLAYRIEKAITRPATACSRQICGSRRQTSPQLHRQGRGLQDLIEEGNPACCVPSRVSTRSMNAVQHVRQLTGSSSPSSGPGHTARHSHPAYMVDCTPSGAGRRPISEHWAARRREEDCPHPGIGRIRS